MVWAKMKFPFEKRVKLAQSLWLISWLATLGGAITFCLGCFLKTELRRRAEVSKLTIRKHISTLHFITHNLSQVFPF